LQFIENTGTEVDQRFFLICESDGNWYLIEVIGFCIVLGQCFPTFLGLRHPTEKNNNLWHP